MNYDDECAKNVQINLFFCSIGFCDYNSLKLKPFQKKFDAYKKDDLYLEELNRQQEWGEKQNLTGVPVLLVNSRIVNHSLIDGII